MRSLNSCTSELQIFIAMQCSLVSATMYFLSALVHGDDLQQALKAWGPSLLSHTGMRRTSTFKEDEEQHSKALHSVMKFLEPACRGPCTAKWSRPLSHATSHRVILSTPPPSMQALLNMTLPRKEQPPPTRKADYAKQGFQGIIRLTVSTTSSTNTSLPLLLQRIQN